MPKMIKSEINEIVAVNKSKICGDTKGKAIVNRYQEKVYKFGYDKRAIRRISESHINTTPYGY